MQYRGYQVLTDGVSTKIETLHGTLIDETSSPEKAERIIDGWLDTK